MKLTQITAIALALLVVGAGAVAAIPGQAADQAQDRANEGASDDVDQGPVPFDLPDDAGDAAENASDAGANASEAGANVSDAASERRGPPVDMPDQVPDHVRQIHEAINSWLDSDGDGSLGDLISDLVGGGDETDEQRDDGDGSDAPADQPDETPTPAGTESDA